MVDKEQVSVLDRQVKYSGEGLSVRSLEEMIDKERTSQNVQVEHLKVLRERNSDIQKTLQDEVQKLRKLSDYVSSGKLKGNFWITMKEILSYIPGLRKLAITKRSIEELLRQQYEISVKRVKEAADFADRLKAAESDLYDEIQRLNQKIIEAAKNEQLAAGVVLELKAHMTKLEGVVAGHEADGDGVAVREAQADVDKARRMLAEHSTQLKLYDTAEERLGRLKEATVMLSDTINALRSDISQYVLAASEKLDLVAGQLRAIGTAADASMVILEMKKSLDSMSESMNHTTRFVAETQLYFQNNLDKLLSDLDVYDGETTAVLKRNLELTKQAEHQRIADAVEIAKRISEREPHAPTDAAQP